MRREVFSAWRSVGIGRSASTTYFMPSSSGVSNCAIATIPYCGNGGGPTLCNDGSIRAPRAEAAGQHSLRGTGLSTQDGWLGPDSPNRADPATSAQTTLLRLGDKFLKFTTRLQTSQRRVPLIVSLGQTRLADAPQTDAKALDVDPPDANMGHGITTSASTLA